MVVVVVVVVLVVVLVLENTIHDVPPWLLVAL